LYFTHFVVLPISGDCHSANFFLKYAPIAGYCKRSFLIVQRLETIMRLSFLDKDWFRGIVFALIIIGVVAGLFAAQQFIDATLRMQNNASFIAKSSDTALELQSEAEAQMLMAADVEYRRLRLQRDNALFMGGLGLTLLALGWIGGDFTRARRRKLNAPFQSESG
jgi:hypothetical protein